MIRVPTALNQKDKRATGRFDVRLYFADPFAKSGERVFDVSIEGKKVLTDFDVAAEKNALIVREFKNVEISGPLDITFESKQGDSILCGIEIVRVNKAE